MPNFVQLDRFLLNLDHVTHVEYSQNDGKDFVAIVHLSLGASLTFEGEDARPLVSACRKFKVQQFSPRYTSPDDFV